MKIGLRSHNGAVDRLLFTQQIGAHGASIWASACPDYDERCYLTAEDVRMMRARFETIDELTLALNQALDYWNAYRHPYRWKKIRQEQVTLLGGFGMSRSNQISDI